MSDSNSKECPIYNKIIIGSRDSPLAMKQTYIIKDKLELLYPHIEFSIVPMKTKGDFILDKALSKIGKNIFTKELEDALLKNEVDIVVHSMKDMPTSLPIGLIIGAVHEREDSRDAVLMAPKMASMSLATLPKYSVIGTSSTRRIAEIMHNNPHLKTDIIRGNLNTRLRKLDEGVKYSALVLAAAGVKRMNWESRIAQLLDPTDFPYAVGQGALAVECRESDVSVLSLLQPLSHEDTLCQVLAERALMCGLAGGCFMPLGAHSKVQDDVLTLTGSVYDMEGNKLKDTVSVHLQRPQDYNKKQDKELLENKDLSLTEQCDAIDPPKKRQRNESPSSYSTSPSSFCGVLPPLCSRNVAEQSHNLGHKLAEILFSKGAQKFLDKMKQQNTEANSSENFESKQNESESSESNGKLGII